MCEIQLSKSYSIGDKLKENWTIGYTGRKVDNVYTFCWAFRYTGHNVDNVTHFVRRSDTQDVKLITFTHFVGRSDTQDVMLITLHILLDDQILMT